MKSNCTNSPPSLPSPWCAIPPSLYKPPQSANALTFVTCHSHSASCTWVSISMCLGCNGWVVKFGSHYPCDDFKVEENSKARKMASLLRCKPTLTSITSHPNFVDVFAKVLISVLFLMSLTSKCFSFEASNTS